MPPGMPPPGGGLPPGLAGLPGMPPGSMAGGLLGLAGHPGMPPTSSGTHLEFTNHPIAINHNFISVTQYQNLF